jgi:alpha-tubulin suppressor-like RCC1 family protein
VPVIVQAPGATQYTVVRGMLSSYAVTAGGKLYAWGLNSVGQLGDGTKTMRLKPVQVKLPAGVKVTAVRAGGSFALALTSTGRVLSWGANNAGQLGNGTFTSSMKAVRAKLPAGVKVTALVAGKYFSMALTSKHNIMTWGSNDSGQLGNGTTAGSSTPVNVSLPPFTAYAIGAGWGSSTALTTGKFQPL